MARRKVMGRASLVISSTKGSHTSEVSARDLELLIYAMTRVGWPGDPKTRDEAAILLRQLEDWTEYLDA